MKPQTTLFQVDDEMDELPDSSRELEQYFTPRWFADIIVAREFGDLEASRHFVLDPGTGRGSWLHAIPRTVRAIGIEIDPALASIAAADTKRTVLSGDFLTMPIDVEPTHILGNPPFRLAKAFIRRAYDLLPAGGFLGYVLPAHCLSFSSATLSVLRGFDVSVSLAPRDLYPRISVPLIFAKMQKSKTERLIGLALYREAAAVRSLRMRYRRILEQGRKPIWHELLILALEALGGEGSIEDVCRIIEDDMKPTDTRFLRDYLRRDARDLVNREKCDRARPGYFRLRPGFNASAA